MNAPGYYRWCFFRDFQASIFSIYLWLAVVFHDMVHDLWTWNTVMVEPPCSTHIYSNPIHPPISIILADPISPIPTKKIVEGEIPLMWETQGINHRWVVKILSQKKVGLQFSALVFPHDIRYSHRLIPQKNLLIFHLHLPHDLPI